MSNGVSDRRPRRPFKPRWPVIVALSVTLAPTALEAQACLGLGSKDFLAITGAVRREWSRNAMGVGGIAGLSLGSVVATARYLKFGVDDEFDEEPGFDDVRVNLAVELPISRLSLCPVMTAGVDAVSSRNHSSVPHANDFVYGGGVGLGHRFTPSNSSLVIVPSLMVSIENHVARRLYDDIWESAREFSGVVRGGVTVELERILVRPYAAFTTADNSYVLAGAILAVTF